MEKQYIASLHKKKACRDDKPFIFIVSYYRCFVHDDWRKLFHHQVLFVIVFIFNSWHKYINEFWLSKQNEQKILFFILLKNKPQRIIVGVCEYCLYFLKLIFQSHFQFKFVRNRFVSNAFEEWLRTVFNIIFCTIYIERCSSSVAVYSHIKSYWLCNSFDS